MSFEACLPFILSSEGGFADNPRDPGGATNLGITLRTLASFRKAPQTVADVQALTVADVTPIYLAGYWNVAHCGQLPAGVDLMAFDEAVNQGPGHAIVDIQVALGVTADGAFGPHTALAALGCSPAAVIAKIATEREARYRADPEFAEFGEGWLNRLTRTAAEAHAMVTP
jgi:lysozyme family protein